VVLDLEQLEQSEPLLGGTEHAQLALVDQQQAGGVDREHPGARFAQVARQLEEVEGVDERVGQADEGADQIRLSGQWIAPSLHRRRSSPRIRDRTLFGSERDATSGRWGRRHPSVSVETAAGRRTR
jgi:hypothetical protein